MDFSGGLPVLMPSVGIFILIMYLVLCENGRRSSRPACEVILDERYAGGELTREQYMQTKDDIKSPLIEQRIKPICDLQNRTTSLYTLNVEYINGQKSRSPI